MLKRPVSSFDIDIHRKKKHQTFVRSRYEFLTAHNGIRPTSLHGLMGTTGCGKSTLLKCMIAEFAIQHRVLIWLSEETVEEYQELIQELDPSVLNNIAFVEEKEIPESIKSIQSNFLEYFEQMHDDFDPFITVIDNVTTSAFYNTRYGIMGQNKTAEFLRDFPKRKERAILYVAHTQSNITENYNKTINAEDIRGSKELSLNTEYLYIIQKFTTDDKIYNLLRVAKYRHHEEASGWYALKYAKSCYIGDERVSFELVNRVFKSRDFLGRADRKKKKEVKTDTKKEEKKEEKKES